MEMIDEGIEEKDEAAKEVDWIELGKNYCSF